MNVISLRQRVEKLEALSVLNAAPRPLHPLAKLLDVLVAYHLGGLTGSDSIAAGMARGLGYDSPQVFRTALGAGSGSPASEEMNARWRDAMVRLFDLKGAAPDCDGPTFGDVVEALFYEMPEEVQHHSFLSPEDRLPEAVYDFLLEGERGAGDLWGFSGQIRCSTFSMSNGSSCCKLYRWAIS